LDHPHARPFPTRRSSDLAMTLSDRIVVMRDGNIEQVGTPVEIYTRPATRFVASFIGTANLIPARVEQKGGQGITLRLGEKTLEVDRKSTRLNSSHVKISY